MTTSSQLPNYSTDLFSGDTYTITIDPISPIDNVYIDTTMSGTSSITLGAVGSSYSINDTITLNSEYQFNWGEAEEWIDAFPDWRRVQDMCKKYPGLEIALRNFQTVYTLVKDDYDNPKDEG
jgi:hypothetical protein